MKASEQLTIVLGVSLLASCAADSAMLDQVMVVPGYFETLSCPELVGKYRTATQRVRTLILLMEKSSEEFGGALVNAVAYNTEYAKARSVQKHAEEAAVLKRCDLNEEPPPKPAGAPEPQSLR
jgi:hypothetical protein